MNIINLKDTKISAWISKLHHSKPIHSTDVTLFIRQFATLIAAGIPIIQSCDILAKIQEKKACRMMIHAIKLELLRGKSLCISLRQHPLQFSDFVCQLVQIGEQTGKLETMLLAIAHHEEKNLAFKKNIQHTLFYPCIIASLAFIITLGMLIFVVPKFAELFQDSQAKLPAISRLIFYFSALARQASGILFILLCLSLFFTFRSPYLKTKLKQTILRLPGIYSIVNKTLLARFARHLALTLHAGLPIMNGLMLVSDASNHSSFAKAGFILRKKISTGMALHHAMAETAYFPSFIIQMVKIGEEAGTLEYMLDKTAEFFESEVDRLLGRVSQLLEPLLMVVLGVLIGGLIIGMYLPVFNLGSAL